jgi:hypothetical protein
VTRHEYVDLNHVEYFVTEDSYYTDFKDSAKTQCWGVSRRAGRHSHTISFYSEKQDAEGVAYFLNISRGTEVQR